jgi:farnesyl-diphosphate farnesyltransferase
MTLSTTQQSYLDAQMNAVSRSFALVVACLEQPLRAHFATAYLLCRVADNIEDCTAPAGWKAERFADFERMLAQPESAPTVLPGWEAAPWPGLTANERRLMGAAGGHELWSIFAAITPLERAIIAHWAYALADGMRRLDDPDHEPHFVEQAGVKVLVRPADYDRYCYIVAGTVGHMATELVTCCYGVNGAAGVSLQAASEACGRALQKTNILKDFAEDLERGVCYLPDTWLQATDRSPLALAGASNEFKQVVFADLCADLHVATEYVLNLPLTARDYRMASLLCLLPALQTNRLAAQRSDRLFTAAHGYKISRVEMGRCMLDARRMVGDNAQILAYSRHALAQIHG